jgi:hypothetical protein
MDLVNLDLLYEHLTLGIPPSPPFLFFVLVLVLVCARFIVLNQTAPQGCIGETIDPENTITGIRVVDKRYHVARLSPPRFLPT